MSFEIVKKNPGGRRNHQVSMSLRRDNGRDGLLYVFVTLGPEALRLLGAKKHDCVRVERGIGEDAGCIRLTKTADFGRSLHSPSRNRLRFYFRAWDGMAQEPQYATVCKMRVVGQGVIEVTLPPWADTKRAATTTPIVPGAFARKRA